MKKIILAVALGLGLSSLERARAAGPFSVSTLSDTHAVSPATSANDGSGQISLRSAIEAANAQAGATTITVPPGTYMLTLGELSVAPAGGKTITIQSTGTAVDTIVSQMDHTNRVFNIDPSSAGGTVVTLSGLTIQGGRDGGDQLGGAGILAGSVAALPKDVLNLTGCRILNNHCQDQGADYTAQPGGGVQMAGGDLHIASCIFSNNTSASSQGGAIEFFALSVNSTLNIDNSSFFNNSLTNTSGSGLIGGGAIDIRSTAGSVHAIRNSTFAGDRVVSTVGNANTVGGAIYFSAGVLDVSNSVFTGNSAIGTGGLGGAIFADSGTLSLNGCRLTDNVANGGGGALYNRGSNGASSTAINCWWGCNDGPGASGCDVAASDAVGTLITSPFIVLSNAPSLNPIGMFQSATFTASFRYNSAGTLLTPAQISALVGLPVSWGSPVLGTLSGAQTSLQADGTASATFTAGQATGIGSVTASVNQAVATGAVTIDCPSITATVSGGAAFCAGGAGVIQVDVTGGYPPYTVTLNNGGGTQTGYSPLRFTNSPAMTTVYQMATGTDTNGCSILATGSATNTVYAAPDGTITAATTGVCAGSTGNLASVPAGAAGYAWTISNGTIAGPANAASVTYAAGSAGAVTLGVTVSSTNGCVTVAATNVLINLLPVTPTIQAATSVCAGSAGNLATAGGAIPVVKPLDAPTKIYAWTIGNGTITSATNLATITYTAGSTGAVSLAVVVINASGCSASAVAEVAIAAHPTAVVSGSATTSTGSSTPLLAALTGTAPWTVTWSDGFVQTTNASPALHYVSPTNNLPEPTNYTYTVTALTDGSCVAGETDLSGSAVVTVYSMPVAPTNLTEVAAVCYETPNPVLTVAVAAGATVDWYDAATEGNQLINTSLVYLPTNSAAGTYTNYAQARDLSTGTVNTNRTPVVFTINALPTAVVSGDVTICNGDSAVLSVALTGVSPWTIQWFDGVIQTTNASPAIRVVTPANMLGSAPTNMIYFLSAAADANCSADSATVRSTHATITVNPLPASALIRTSSRVCAGSAGNVASGPAGAKTYAWTITNGVITSAMNTSNITYTANGEGMLTLGVTVFNTYGCSVSGVTNVIINPLPTTPGILAAESVCAGSSGNTAEATSMVPGVVGKTGVRTLTYVWAITNGVITSATNVSAISYTAGTNGAVGLTVVAVNEFGCSAGTEIAVPINTLPTAVVSGDATICNGDSAVLSVALTGVSPWTIQWSDGVIQTTNASPAIRVVSPANGFRVPTNFIFNVTGLADANCSTEATNNLTGLATITVNPLPLVFIHTPGGVCVDSTGNVASGQPGAKAYAWTITNGVITSAINMSNITYTAGTSGVVSLGLTVFNTYGCSEGAVRNLPIYPRPTTLVIAADAGVCAGSSGNSASVSAPPTMLYSWSWSITNGVITSDATATNITYTAGTNGAVGLTVVAVNEFGCSGGTEIAVPINALPTAVVSGDATICNGDSAVLSVALTGVSPWTIQWSDGVIQTTNASPAIRVVSPANSVGVPTNFSFSVTGLADAHCSTEATNNLTGLATITVNPLPGVPVVGLAEAVCAGSTDNQASVPAGAAAYAWTINNGTIVGATNTSSVTYTAADTGVVTLTATIFNDFGCSVSTETNVPINPLPQAPIIAADTGVCAGSSGNGAEVINLTPMGVDKKLRPKLTYLWSITNGVITSATNVPAITYTAGTNGAVGLTVVFYTEYGCSTGTEIAVPINALPEPPIIGLSPASVCAQSAGNTASGPAGAVAFAWTITNGTITSATNLSTVTYTAGETGSVTLGLTVWNESGCSAGSVTNVTINALPALPLVSLSTASLCGNSTGNTAAGPVGATAYAWTISNGVITSQTNMPVITYTAGASGAVTLGLTVFNESGCSTTVATNVVIDPDVVAPDITCPGNLLVIVPAGTSGSNVTFTVPVVDNCDPNPLVTIVPPSGSTFLPGTTTVNVTAADHSGNTNTCQFTVRVHPEPAVSLITPTNSSLFVVPQNIALLADAANPDASIRQVDFYEHTNLLGSATSGFWFNWTNVVPGSYQLLAVATDDLGVSGTSAVVNVSMLAHVPLPVGSIFPVETNSLRVRQTGLLYQQVHVSNVTPLTMAALRLSISNLPPAVRVWNATGTNNGLPYLLYNQPLAPGESVDFLIEYQVADGRTMPNPTFICDLIPTETPLEPMGTVLAVNPRPWGGTAPLVEFRTQTNRVYYIQYSPDLTTWKTALPAINGTGSSVQWLDNGPPKTESLPSSVPARFYRVLLIP